MSAKTGSSECRANRTSISELVDSESKSCLAAKEALSISRLHIYRHSYLWAITILGRDFGYAATIAPVRCGDAAPNRRGSGCVLGRSEIVSRLCEIQEFPKRCGSAGSDEHHPHPKDRHTWDAAPR